MGFTLMVPSSSIPKCREIRSYNVFVSCFLVGVVSLLFEGFFDGGGGFVDLGEGVRALGRGDFLGEDVDA